MKKAVCIIAILSIAALLFAKAETRRIWSFKTDGQTTLIRFIYNNHLYITGGEYMAFGMPSHKVYCINRFNGKVKWTYDLGKNKMISTFRLDKKKGSIFIMTVEDKTVILNADNGKVAGYWQKNIPLKIRLNHHYRSSKVIAESIGRNHVIYCKKNGKTLFKIQFPQMHNTKYPKRIKFSYAVKGDYLYVARYNGRVLAYHIGKQ